MENKKKISAIKADAREHLLAQYGRMTGLTVLYFIISFTLNNIISAISMSFESGSTDTVGNDVLSIMQATTSQMPLTIVLSLIVTVLMGTIITGYYNVCLKLVRGEEYSVKDMFYVFKHDPDKVVIIYFIQAIAGVLIYIPLGIYNVFLEMNVSPGLAFFISMVLFTVLLVLYVVILILLSLSSFFYLDNSDWDAKESIFASIKIMRKEGFRFFYLTINMYGWMLIALLSCGIGLIWIMPYQYSAYAVFYEEVKGEVNGHITEA